MVVSANLCVYNEEQSFSIQVTSIWERNDRYS